MNKLVLAVSMAAAAALSGCASMPSADKIASADYGTPISTEDATALVTSYMKSTAKDPYSLKVECGSVRTGWTQNKFTSSSFIAGYMIDCGVNGKNSFGAYVGVRNYRFVIRNGSVVRLMEQMSNGGYGPASTVDAMRNSGLY
jgi:hypothetical protein